MRYGAVVPPEPPGTLSLCVTSGIGHYDPHALTSTCLVYPPLGPTAPSYGRLLSDVNTLVSCGIATPSLGKPCVTGYPLSAYRPMVWPLWCSAVPYGPRGMGRAAIMPYAQFKPISASSLLVRPFGCGRSTVEILAQAKRPGIQRKYRIV